MLEIKTPLAPIQLARSGVADVTERFHVEERRHAALILATDFPEEFNDIVECLRQF